MDHDANGNVPGRREPSTFSKGKMCDNPFDDPLGEMDFNVQLLFQYKNAFGALIYKDPLGRYTFKTDDNHTPFNEFPMLITKETYTWGKMDQDTK